MLLEITTKKLQYKDDIAVLFKNGKAYKAPFYEFENAECFSDLGFEAPDGFKDDYFPAFFSIIMESWNEKTQEYEYDGFTLDILEI